MTQFASRSPSPPESRSFHGLWSLWDLMHKLHSEVFFKAYEQAATFHQMLSMVVPQMKPDQHVTLLKGDAQEKIARLEVLRDELVAMGLPGAAACFKRALEIFKAAPEVMEHGQPGIALSMAPASRIQVALSQGTSRIPDDLAEYVLLALDARRQHLFSELRPFGDEVFDAFPAARSDIEEAAKCLAVERGTACVFHIMRALESAAGVIATKIGATVVDQHGRGLPWGVIAENMKPKIDAMAKGSEEQIKWYRVQNELVVVNRAWRVPTNHPKESYLPSEAQEVFDATKTFMQDLAPLI